METIDLQHFDNLAANCSNLTALTMNFLGSTNYEIRHALWKMVLTMVKQASNLSDLSLHCSGLDGRGQDLCDSLQESNTTSLTIMQFACHEGFFSSNEKCKQWAAIFKKQTGL